MTDTVHLPSWCAKGVEVVCITDLEPGWPNWLPLPIRHPMINEVLTIASVAVSDAGESTAGPITLTWDAGVFLTFDEIPRIQSASANGLTLTAAMEWPASAFRPLLKQKRSRRADVALFKTTDVREPAL